MIEVTGQLVLNVSFYLEANPRDVPDLSAQMDVDKSVDMAQLMPNPETVPLVISIPQLIDGSLQVEDFEFFPESINGNEIEDEEEPKEGWDASEAADGKLEM